MPPMKEAARAPAHICLPISAALTIICRSAPAKEAARAPPAKFAGTGEKPPRKHLRGGFGGRKALHAADGGPLRIAFSVINAFCRQKGF